MDNNLVMENYLLVLKSTVEVYVHGTLESSNNGVRKNLKDSLSDILTSQADTYDLMTKYGWYKVDNIKPKEIDKTIKKLNCNN